MGRRSKRAGLDGGSLHYRQTHGELAPLTHDAGDFHTSCVHFHQPLDQAKADSQAPL